MNRAPEPLASVFAKLAAEHPGGDYVAFAQSDADMARIFAGHVTRATALEMCQRFKAKRVRKQLRDDLPPRGHVWCVLSVDGYGTTLVPIELPMRVSAPGGAA
jgi:hypothetical protein